MQREPSVFLQDILAAAETIEKYTRGLAYDDFLDNDLTSFRKKSPTSKRSVGGGSMSPGLFLYALVVLPLFIPVMVKTFGRANWWPFMK